jgi:hypothetical protein
MKLKSQLLLLVIIISNCISLFAQDIAKASPQEIQSGINEVIKQAKKLSDDERDELLIQYIKSNSHLLAPSDALKIAGATAKRSVSQNFNISLNQYVTIVQHRLTADGFIKISNTGFVNNDANNGARKMKYDMIKSFVTNQSHRLTAYEAIKAIDSCLYNEIQDELFLFFVKKEYKRLSKYDIENFSIRIRDSSIQEEFSDFYDQLHDKGHFSGNTSDFIDLSNPKRPISSKTKFNIIHN